MNWSPLTTFPTWQIMSEFAFSQASFASLTRVSSAAKIDSSIRGIMPTGSPSGETSMSCCWAQRESTMSPISNVLLSEPATPVFITVSTEKMSIRICVQTAIFTFPMPLTTTTVFSPHRFPSTKVIPALVISFVSVICSFKMATSSSIAPINPMVFM